MTATILVITLSLVGASASLAWFLVAAAAALWWLHRTTLRATIDARRQPMRLPVGTTISLAGYALLLSIAVLTVRAALGLLDRPTIPFAETGLAPALRRSSLGFYDKSEVRLALLELLLFTAAFAALFVRSAIHRLARVGRPLLLHPATAAFSLVLYFACIRLPPFPADGDQWLALLATGGVRRAALAAWLSWFGASTLSLAVAAALCNLVAGSACFALIRKLTGSPAAAMVGASYALLEATNLHSASLMLPAPAHVALAMLLIYFGLSKARMRWLAFLPGVILAWDPPFGLASPSAAADLRLAVAPVLPLFLPGLVLLALRSTRPRRSWTRRQLFVGASLVCAIPSATASLIQHDAFASFEANWILLPSAALAIHTCVRLLSRNRRAPGPLQAAFSARMTPVIFLVLFDLLFPVHRLNEVVARHATSYELERQKWYTACAAGRTCDPQRKPSLSFYLRQARSQSTPAEGPRRGAT